MYKKIVLVLSVVAFFFVYNFAFASLVINEIMYDLSGSDSTSSKSREWVEVYNPDGVNVDVDASKWRIYDGSANRTINGEVNFSIPAGGYIIFAGDKDAFLLDHAGFSGIVYDTGITSLNNAGAILKVLDQDLNIIDSVTYASSQGGAGDGNSLQKIAGGWQGASPTPGVQNETSVPPPVPPSENNQTSTSSSTQSSSSSSEVKIPTIEERKIKTQIIGKTLGFAGVPVLLEGRVYDSEDKDVHYGKLFWNFGDGDSVEIRLPYNNPQSHIYFYPGDYVVSLAYYQDYYANVPVATSQLGLKVVSAQISVSKVGDEKDFFVELSNNTEYNADLSNWILSAGAKTFVLPVNTNLGPGKKIIISPKITSFSFADKNSLKLMTAQREIVFDYGDAEKSIVTEPPKSSLPRGQNPDFPSSFKRKLEEVDVPISVSVPGISENLPALALNSDGPELGQESSYSFPFIPVVSFLFIGASASAVYYVRRKMVVPQSGSDFEILDE